MVRLRQLEAEATTTGAIYQDYLLQHKRMTTGADLQLPDADMIATAKDPFQPSSPKRGLIVLGSIAVSGILASLLALVLERNHKGFRSTEEFTAQTGIPVLGLLPRLSRRARRRFHAASQPRLYHEVLDLVAARLWAPDITRQGRVFAVTSAAPGEGKTWFSISLSTSLAQIGARTLLIDCDLRRGSIARALGIGSPGLTNVQRYYDKTAYRSDSVAQMESRLPGRDDGQDGVSNLPGIPVPEARLFRAAREAGVVRSISPNLDVVPVFSHGINVLEFLTSTRFRDFVQDARSYYDFILIDTPPVMMLADGLILSRMADSVLLVAQWCKTPRPAVTSTIRSLSDSGVHIGGAVLTKVNTRRYASARLGENAYFYRKYAGH